MSDPELEVHPPTSLILATKDQHLTRICDQNEPRHLQNPEKYTVSKNSVQFDLKIPENSGAFQRGKLKNNFQTYVPGTLALSDESAQIMRFMVHKYYLAARSCYEHVQKHENFMTKMKKERPQKVILVPGSYKIIISGENLKFTFSFKDQKE